MKRLKQMGSRQKRLSALLLFIGGVFTFCAAMPDGGRSGREFPAVLHCPDEFDLRDVRKPGELRIKLLPPIQVTVTAYSSTEGQTDSTPFITASMTRVRPGVIALSRDLIRRYTPGAPFQYGDRVYIEGHGVFVVEDTMNKRYSRRADIWFPSTSEALEFGRRELDLCMVSGSSTEGISGSSARSASAPVE